MASYLSLGWTILKCGKIQLPRFEYEDYRDQTLGAIVKQYSLSPSKEKGNKLARKLIRFPLVGPMISVASFIVNQKRTPTYIFHHPNKKIAYIRISKSACSSIQASLLSDIYDKPDSDFKLEQIHFLGMYHLHPKLKEGYECFTLLRDPVARLLSCYNDKVNYSGEGFFYYQDYMAGIITPNMNFSSFLKTIDQIPDHLKDMHFRPQYCFINPVGIQNVRLFRLDQDAEEIKEYLDEFDLKWLHRHQNKNKVLTQSDLGESDIRLIERMYKKDYQLIRKLQQ